MSSDDRGRNGGPDGTARGQLDAARGRLDLVQNSDGAEPEERAEDIASASASLRAALAPEALDDADHEALLALALGEAALSGELDEDVADGGPGEDVAEHDAEELRQAEALRQALDGAGQHGLAAWAGALRYAWDAPEPLAHADHEALLALSLGVEAELSGAQAATAASEGPELSAWTTALRAAWQPDAFALDGADHEALLALSGFDQDEQLISAQEHTAAQALREALDGAGEHPLAQLAEGLRHAAMPSDLDQLSYERILSRAMAAERSGSEDSSTSESRETATTHKLVQQQRARRGMLLTALVAMAASVALFVGSLRWLETRPGSTQTAQAGAVMAVSRSTTDLFDPMTPFPAKGGESERMKRIVASRSADLRANRFAAWGVR